MALTPVFATSGWEAAALVPAPVAGVWEARGESRIRFLPPPVVAGGQAKLTVPTLGAGPVDAQGSAADGVKILAAVAPLQGPTAAEGEALGEDACGARRGGCL